MYKLWDFEAYSDDSGAETGEWSKTLFHIVNCYIYVIYVISNLKSLINSHQQHL